MKPLPVEPFDPVDVALQDEQDAAPVADVFIQEVEERLDHLGYEGAPPFVRGDGARCVREPPQVVVDAARVVVDGDAVHHVPDQGDPALLRGAWPREAASHQLLEALVEAVEVKVLNECRLVEDRPQHRLALDPFDGQAHVVRGGAGVHGLEAFGPSADLALQVMLVCHRDSSFGCWCLWLGDALQRLASDWLAQSERAVGFSSRTWSMIKPRSTTSPG